MTKRCKDCGFEGTTEQFTLFRDGLEFEDICPECDSDSVEDIE